MASAPALQWVSTRASGGSSGAPSAPMRRQAASSSSRMAWASARMASAGSPMRRDIRRTAQARFTAVGRARASSSAAARSRSGEAPRRASTARP